MSVSRTGKCASKALPGLARGLGLGLCLVGLSLIGASKADAFTRHHHHYYRPHVVHSFYSGLQCVPYAR